MKLHSSFNSSSFLSSFISHVCESFPLPIRGFYCSVKELMIPIPSSVFSFLPGLKERVSLTNESAKNEIALTTQFKECELHGAIFTGMRLLKSPNYLNKEQMHQHLHLLISAAAALDTTSYFGRTNMN